MFSLTLALSAVTIIQASAFEYTESDQPAGDFATATSVEPVKVVGGENIYTRDVSKDTAITPPPFGFAIGTPTAPTPPSVSIPSIGGTTSPPIGSIIPTPPLYMGYTPVTEHLYHSDGSLGILSIPDIKLQVSIYEGTGDSPLKKGAGHFENTSIWNGNVAIAGHNRGVNNHFGKIHTLDIGDEIELLTKLGAREYEVYSVRKISVNDVSVLNPSAENIITLVTCVMNQPNYRWCVQARAV